MKIVIPGGSGQVGQILARAFSGDGHEVVVLSRASAQVVRTYGRPIPTLARSVSEAAWRVVAWDGESLGDWTEEIEGADVVINLAGRSVNCRYNAANREAIKQSRIRSTHVIGEAIAKATHPPRVWLQASTATIYAHRYDAANDEATGILGGREENAPDTWQFSIDVATSWEWTVNQAFVPRTRKVLMRSALTLSPDPGGVFDVLLGLVRRGLGGRCGDGRQFVSWIHDQDFVRAVYWLIDNEFAGPVNLCSPNPIPNAEFMRDLRQAWGIRFGLPAMRWMLEIGAFFMRTETELILKSRRVIPGRLLQSGFPFRFPTWPEAAADLCRRWRESHQGQPKSAEPMAMSR